MKEPEDSVEEIVEQVDGLIANGICYHCSLRVVSMDYEADKGRIEAVYLKEKLKEEE